MLSIRTRVGLALLLCSALTRAQNPEDLTLLSEADLMEKARAKSALVEVEQASLDSLLEADATFRSRLAEKEERLQGLDDPQPPFLGPGASAWEFAAAELTWIEQRIEVLEARKLRSAEIGGLLEERAGQLGSLEAQAGRLADARQSLALVWDEVARRLAAQTMEATPADYDPEGLRARQNALEDRRAAWKTESTAVPGRLSGLRSQAEQYDDNLEHLTEERAAAQTRSSEAQQRKSFHETFSDDDPASLLSIAPLRVEEWEQQDEEVRAAQADIAERESAIDRQQAELKALGAPQPDTITVEPGPESWRKAQKQRALAEARLAYHQARDAQLAGLEPALSVVSQGYADLLPELEKLWTRTLELDVLRGYLEDLHGRGVIESLSLPEQAAAESLSVQLERLRGLPTQLSGVLEVRREALAEVRARLESNRDTIAEIEAQLPELRQEEERERSWAAWSVEMQKMSSPDLLQSYSETLAQLEGARAEVAAARSSLEVETKQELELRRNLLENVDPMVRKVQLSLESHRTALRTALLDDQDVPGPPAWDRAGTVSSAEEQDAFTSVEFDDDFSDALKQVRNDFRGRLQFFDERARLLGAHLAVLASREQLLGHWQTAQRAELDAARRVYGAAIVLDGRVRSDELKREQIPGQLAGAIDRDQVSQAADQVEQATAQLDALRARRGRLTAELDGGRSLRDMIEKRLGLVVKKLEFLRHLKELSAAYEQIGESGTELEAQRREQEILFELEEGNRWHESFLLLFESERAAAHTQLLFGYTEEMLDLENKLENLKQRETRCDLLVRVVRDQQTLLGELEPLVETRMQRLGAAAEIERLRAMTVVAGDPVRRSEVLEKMRETIAQMPASHLATVDTHMAARTLVEAAERPALASELANQIFDLQTSYLAYSERLAELQKAGGRQVRSGHLEAQILAIEAQKAKLKATQEEIEAQRQTLTGHSQEQLDALPEYERPVKASDRKRFLDGDIAWTRAQRMEELIWEAEKTVIWLALIPIIALIMIRMANGIGRRLVVRVETIEISPDSNVDIEVEKRERKERAATLFQVFTKAWSILVWVLATIYLLKAMRLDVTPLIASAGILGLAVAFGAQPLVRDFFAGFFILLEDQYSLGDYVTVDGIGGTVERITLRLTIIRDLKGTLHYIPNGNVGRVSNYTKDWARAVLEIGIGYGDDPDKAIAELNKIGEELKADSELGPTILDFSVPGVHELGDNAVVIRVYIKVRSGDQWSIAREARLRIKKRFDEVGISIPFPQRTLHIKFEEPADAAQKELVKAALAGKGPVELGPTGGAS